jgi:hypothetical protein
VTLGVGAPGTAFADDDADHRGFKLAKNQNIPGYGFLSPGQGFFWAITSILQATA